MARTRILVKRKSGEPSPTRVKNSWGVQPGRNSVRRKLSIRMLKKIQPQERVMKGVETQTVSSDGLQRVTAGTVVPGTQARGRTVRKVQKLNPSPAKGTKIIKPPSPTNRGGVRNAFTRKKV